MYSESDIDHAVAAGALSADAAASFRAHVATLRATPAADEESFRLITGFNDIFVTIAILVLLFAIGAGLAGGIVVAGVVTTAVSWGLAEFFTRERRMALPSIVLLVSFVGSVAVTVASALSVPLMSDTKTGILIAITGAVASAAAALHWWRFHVPITIAAGAVALLAFLLGIVLAVIPAAREALWAMLLVGGIAVFTLAMRWDLSDPERRTRRADVAFWLHLAAAPLIAHSTFQLLGVFDGDLSAGRALLVLGLYILFGVVALAIDRRALLVSGLAYVLYALGTLLTGPGGSDVQVPITAFVIGSALLLLSALWQQARRLVVTPLGPLARRLPPTSV